MNIALMVGPSGGGLVDKICTVGTTGMNNLKNLINLKISCYLFIVCCKGIQTSCDICYQRHPSDNETAI